MKKLQNLTDERLITLHLKGDNFAFDVLFSRYKTCLTLHISSIINKNDLVDDLLQETFLKAYNTIRIGRYKEKGQFRPWIIRIAYNLAIDKYRQGRGECILYEYETDKDLFNSYKFSEKTIEDLLIEEQIYMDIRKLIQQLPDKQEEVINMRYYQNMSFKEIAIHTGVSINTALGRMRYAMQNIRRMIQENNIDLSEFKGK